MLCRLLHRFHNHQHLCRPLLSTRAAPLGAWRALSPLSSPPRPPPCTTPPQGVLPALCFYSTVVCSVLSYYILMFISRSALPALCFCSIVVRSVLSYHVFVFISRSPCEMCVTVAKWCRPLPEDLFSGLDSLQLDAPQEPAASAASPLEAHLDYAAPSSLPLQVWAPVFTAADCVCSSNAMQAVCGGSGANHIQAGLVAFCDLASGSRC